MTKVQAIAEVMKAHNGQADLKTIYAEAYNFYKGEKANTDWKAGLRGVLYREVYKGQTFKKIDEGTYALA